MNNVINIKDLTKNKKINLDDFNPEDPNVIFVFVAANVVSGECVIEYPQGLPSEHILELLQVAIDTVSGKRKPANDPT